MYTLRFTRLRMFLSETNFLWVNAELPLIDKFASAPPLPFSPFPLPPFLPSHFCKLASIHSDTVFMLDTKKKGKSLEKVLFCSLYTVKKVTDSMSLTKLSLAGNN